MGETASIAGVRRGGGGILDCRFGIEEFRDVRCKIVNGIEHREIKLSAVTYGIDLR